MENAGGGFFDGAEVVQDFTESGARVVQDVAVGGDEAFGAAPRVGFIAQGDLFGAVVLGREDGDPAAVDGVGGEEGVEGEGFV